MFRLNRQKKKKMYVHCSVGKNITQRRCYHDFVPTGCKITATDSVSSRMIHQSPCLHRRTHWHSQSPEPRFACKTSNHIAGASKYESIHRVSRGSLFTLPTSATSMERVRNLGIASASSLSIVPKVPLAFILEEF